MVGKTKANWLVSCNNSPTWKVRATMGYFTPQFCSSRWRCHVRLSKHLLVSLWINQPPAFRKLTCWALHSATSHLSLAPSPPYVKLRIWSVLDGSWMDLSVLHTCLTTSSWLVTLWPCLWRIQGVTNHQYSLLRLWRRVCLEARHLSRLLSGHTQKDWQRQKSASKHISCVSAACQGFAMTSPVNQAIPHCHPWPMAIHGHRRLCVSGRCLYQLKSGDS